MTVVLKTSGIDDLDHVDEIYNLIKKEADANLMIEQKREDLYSIIAIGDAVIAYDVDGMEGKVVGFFCLEHWANCIELGSIIVHPTYRLKGLAKKLFATVLALWNEKYSKELIILPNPTCEIIVKQNDFSQVPKCRIDLDVWSACDQCLDKPNFPDCRCGVYIYNPSKKSKKEKDDA